MTPYTLLKIFAAGYGMVQLGTLIADVLQHAALSMGGAL